jgi:hypothetical protein
MFLPAMAPPPAPWMISLRKYLLPRLVIPSSFGLLRVGAVFIDDTKLNANASKIRSVRYDRAKELRSRLAADIAALTAKAEAADAEDFDIQWAKLEGDGVSRPLGTDSADNIALKMAPCEPNRHHPSHRNHRRIICRPAARGKFATEPK